MVHPAHLAESNPAVEQLQPLFVDLDGTLVKSDTLIDSLLALLRNRPDRLLGFPRALLNGKAAFKAYVTESVSLDVPHLPYNRAVLQFLQQEHRNGRQIFLATGANVRLAEAGRTERARRPTSPKI